MTRQRCFRANPLPALDLGFSELKELTAVHFCGLLWTQAIQDERSFRTVSWQDQKWRTGHLWVPIISAPMLCLDKLCEMVILSLVDVGEVLESSRNSSSRKNGDARCAENRRAVSRKWAASVVEFCLVDGILPQPQLLLRRGTHSSLWSLLEHMMAGKPEWQRLLRRIPDHLQERAVTVISRKDDVHDVRDGMSLKDADERVPNDL